MVFGMIQAQVGSQRLGTPVLIYPLAQTKLQTQQISFSLDELMSKCDIDSKMCPENLKMETTQVGFHSIFFLAPDFVEHLLIQISTASFLPWWS